MVCTRARQGGGRMPNRRHLRSRCCVVAAALAASDRMPRTRRCALCGRQAGVAWLWWPDQSAGAAVSVRCVTNTPPPDTHVTRGGVGQGVRRSGARPHKYAGRDTTEAGHRAQGTWGWGGGGERARRACTLQGALAEAGCGYCGTGMASAWHAAAGAARRMRPCTWPPLPTPLSATNSHVAKQRGNCAARFDTLVL